MFSKSKVAECRPPVAHSRGERMVLLALNKSLREQIQQWNATKKPSLKRRSIADDDYVPHRSEMKENSVTNKKQQMSPHSKVRRWLQFKTTSEYSDSDSQQTVVMSSAQAAQIVTVDNDVDQPAISSESVVQFLPVTHDDVVDQSAIFSESVDPFLPVTHDDVVDQSAIFSESVDQLLPVIHDDVVDQSAIFTESVDPFLPVIHDDVVDQSAIFSESVDQLLPVISSNGADGGVVSSADHEVQLMTTCVVKRAMRGHPRRTEWKREANKHRRMKGESYTGFAKNESGLYKQSVTKEPRMMGPPCGCKRGNEGKMFKCSEFSDSLRNETFCKFWSEMNWDQRKVYVASNIDKVTKQRKRTEAESSRREQSYLYFLKLGEVRMRVCKEMFLSTLSLGEWSVRNWVEGSCSGMHCEVALACATRPKKPESDGHKFIGEFLNSLPKMESHYCRASTSKLYLEPLWNSLAAVFKEYTVQCKKKGATVMCRKTFCEVFNSLNISLFSPKKDQCDICAMHSVGNISDIDHSNHMQKKEKARLEKSKDKDEAMKDPHKRVYTMDLEAVMLCPLLKASALYYKTKLAVHNFTLFNLASRSAKCYVWHEGEGGLTASVFASMITDFLEHEIGQRSDTEECESEPDTHSAVTEVTIFSDGCTYQNRNAIVSNAILQVAVKSGVTIYQKFLEKGHTQMECDSMHSSIERQLKKRDIQVPSDYVHIIKNARQTPLPYCVAYLDHSFFKDFSSNLVYPSIRPGNKVGDPTVTDIRALRYSMDNTISFKTDFAAEYLPLPRARRATVTSLTTGQSTTPGMYKESLPIKSEKFVHLQQLKKVILSDHHLFYDSLRHICKGQCTHLITSNS